MLQPCPIGIGRRVVLGAGTEHVMMDVQYLPFVNQSPGNRQLCVKLLEAFRVILCKVWVGI